MPKPTRARDGIYTRPDRPGFWGSWTDSSGRRVRKNLDAPTLTQAREELAKNRADAKRTRQEGRSEPSRDTFAAVAARYLGHQKARISIQPQKGRVSKKEYARQSGILEKHLVPFFGTKKIATIRRPAIGEYMTQRTSEVSAGTVIKEMNVLKHLLALAVEEWELIPVNHAHGIKLPEAPKGRVRYLQPQELRGLMSACPEWLRPIVGLAVSTGMRRGELLAIRIADIDVPNGRILLSYTKSGEPRFAYMNKLALQVITSLKLEGRSAKDKLFPDITPERVTVAFIRACHAGKIEDFSFHDLRHTYASHMRMAGADIHTVQQLLGHSDLRMTARYSHLSPGYLGDAVRKLDDVFTEPLVLGTKGSES